VACQFRFLRFFPLAPDLTPSFPSRARKPVGSSFKKVVIPSPALQQGARVDSLDLDRAPSFLGNRLTSLSPFSLTHAYTRFIVGTLRCRAFREVRRVLWDSPYVKLSFPVSSFFLRHKISFERIGILFRKSVRSSQRTPLYCWPFASRFDFTRPSFSRLRSESSSFLGYKTNSLPLQGSPTSRSP